LSYGRDLGNLTWRNQLPEPATLALEHSSE